MAGCLQLVTTPVPFRTSPGGGSVRVQPASIQGPAYCRQPRFALADDRAEPLQPVHHWSWCFSLPTATGALGHLPALDTIRRITAFRPSLVGPSCVREIVVLTRSGESGLEPDELGVILRPGLTRSFSPLRERFELFLTSRFSLRLHLVRRPTPQRIVPDTWGSRGPGFKSRQPDCLRLTPLGGP